jgi:K+-sensing histidine kinase KdpD
VSARPKVNPLTAFLGLRLAAFIGFLEGLLAWLEGVEGGAEAQVSRSLRAHAASDPEDLTRRITWIIGLRWGVVPVVPLLILILSQQHGMVAQAQDDSLATLLPNLALAGASLGLNIIYSVMVRQRRSLKALAYTQIILDVLIFTLTVYSTGGVASPFTFIFFLPILTATLLVDVSAGMLCAAMASALYVGMLYLQHRHVLPVRAVFAPLAALSHDRPRYALLVGTVSVYSFFLVALLAGLLAQVVRRKEQQLSAANHDLTDRMGELSLLFEVASITARTRRVDRVLKEIMALLVLRLDFDRALLYLVDEGGRSLSLKLLARHPRWKDKPPEKYAVRMDLKKSAGLTARAAVERKLYNVTDPLNHPYINREKARLIGLNPFAVAPLVARGRLVGVVGVDHSYSGGPISEQEARSLVIFAGQAALAIENARLASQGPGH